MTYWWNQDMAGSSLQLSGADPQFAVQAATVPDTLLSQAAIQNKLQQNVKEKDARQSDKLGFIDSVSQALSSGYHDIAGAVSSVPVVGGALHDSIKDTIVTPIDKAASAMYWLQSNLISRPLSTTILAQADAQLNDKSEFSGDVWSRAYSKAEHISPGQAATNVGNVEEARKVTGADNPLQAQLKSSGLSEIEGLFAKDLSKDEAQKIVNNQNRYLYDSDYWRKRDGWTYTIGTGLGDGLTSIALDAPGAVLGAGSKAYKAARNIKVITDAKTGERVVQNSLPFTTRNSVADAVNGGAMDHFTEWMAERNRSAAEIENHPIWGSGRRTNPKAATYSQFLVGKDPDTIRLMMRYFAGDRSAMNEIVSSSRSTAADLGTAIDNRKFLHGARIDPDLLEYYRSHGQSVASGNTDPLKLYEPPVERPLEAGPAQAGWDARWGQLDRLSKLHRAAAEDLEKTAGVNTVGPSNSRITDVQNADVWREAQHGAADQLVSELAAKDDFYAKVLGANTGLEAGDVASPALSRLFGSLDEFHRAGTLAVRDTGKAADRAWASKFADRQWVADRTTGGVGGLASQVIRTGMYSTPVRVFHSFGDLMPPGFINHMESGSSGRVADMLRQVKGLTPETRQTLVADYSNAPDKVGRSLQLDKIHSMVIAHVADKYDIDAEMAGHISDLSREGLRTTMSKLTGQRSDQAFAGEVDPATGRRLDLIKVKDVDGDGEALAASPLLQSQLSQGEALLNVKQLDRSLSRNAQAIRTLRGAGADVFDTAMNVADNLSSVWKAANLLRVGYVIRNVAETTGAMTAKLGAMSAIANLGEGGWNFLRNRADYVESIAGTGSYVPSTGAGAYSRFARVRLEDQDALQNVQNINQRLAQQGKAPLPTKRIRVAQGLKVADAFRTQEAESLKGVNKQIADLRNSLDARYQQVGKRAKAQYDLDNASADMADAYARTSQLKMEQAGRTLQIVGKRHAGPNATEDVTLLRDDAHQHTSSVDDLLDIYNQSGKFLDEAEKSAADSETMWGDANWKYQAESLDEMRAWRDRVATELRKGEIAGAVQKSAIENAEKTSAQHVEDFNGVMKNLTKEKDWWATALTASERHEGEMQKRLGKAATDLHYYTDDLGKQSLVDDHKRLQDLLDLKKDHENTIGEFSDYASAILHSAEDAVGRRTGTRDYTYRGYTVPGAYSSKWQHPVSRDEVTSSVGSEVQWARYESTLRNRGAKKTGSWTEIKPGEPGYQESWMHLLNRQFLNDEGMRRLLKDPKEYRTWLKSGAGRTYRGSIGPHGDDVDDLLRKQLFLSSKYIPSPELAQRISEGKQVFWHEVDNAAGENRPVLHGEEVKALNPITRKESTDAALHDTIARAFNRFSTIPTDILANHPVFARLQESHMKNLIDREVSGQKAAGVADPALTEQHFNAMYEESADRAKSDMKQIVYDPQRTSASEALRFVFPFLSAFQDGLQRWFGLIGEKPQLINTVSKIYGAPVAGNMVTDRDGRLVDQHGYATIKDANGKVTGRQFVGMNDRVFHLRWPGGPGQVNKASVPIPVGNLNVFTPGDPWFNPGFGPLVQVAGSTLAEAVPSTSGFMEWAKVLPYGPTSLGQSISPKWVRSTQDAWEAWVGNDQGNDKYQSAMVTIYNKRMADWKLGGEKGNAPKMADVQPEAQHFMFLQALSAFASPAQTAQTPLTGTPYQFYVDQFKQMQQADPQNANDLFYQKYGDDYYQFTTATSKSLGIAPTLEGLTRTNEFKSVLDSMPEMAGFIVGKLDKSKFSQAAYAAQLKQTIGGQPVREKLTAQAAADLNQADLGWRQYGKITDLLDSMMISQGLKSYNSKDAQGISAIRQLAIQKLTAQYPAWEKQFSTVDRGKIQRTIDNFQTLLQNPKIANDPLRQGEISSLRKYLMVRQFFKQQLTDLGSNELNYDVAGNPNNRDPRVNAIASEWRDISLRLREGSLDFGKTYSRYLSQDKLQ